ncbi:DUF4255 domain-containing protein [Saccharothrix sp. Mg75]|uniref:DUF4255 domain-containing protein n=1 Tax=Saccharothrix sp. Mg75 TaxID=3445357 RepID=UPI003EE95A67
MSNFLAVATVTRALQGFLARAVTAVEVGANVSTTKPPAEPTTDALVTVFCYQVTPNAALRNQDAVTRGPDGTVLKRPQAAIDLHYLISFFGDEVELVPQRLLGAVAAALHEQPVLTRADIQDAVGRPPLLGSDLGASPQLVRFTPAQVDLDDLSKLWSTMLQTPYALSVPYLASAVLLDGLSTPSSGTPVLDRRIAVTAFTRPVLDRVLSVAPDAPAGTPPDDGPVTADRHLVLLGANLAGPGVGALVGGLDAEVVRVRDDAVVLAQPPDLPAGVWPVQLRHDVRVGGSTRPWLESNAVPYVRRPRVLDVALVAGTAVRVELDLPVAPEQRVLLLLDEQAPAGGPRGHQFTAPFPASPGTEQTVPVRDVAAGTYLVRVRVDGAESPLIHSGGTFTGPTLDVTG